MVIETYYRKRSKKAHQPRMEMDQAVEGSVYAAEQRQLPHSTLLLRDGQFLIPNDGDDQMQANIKEGYLYEIDHTHLPPRTPTQLRSIRVAMVCEKTELNVAVRFPSMESLRAFFNYSSRESHPALDEKFVMGLALASRVLVRTVAAEVFSEQKSLLAFWLLGSCSAGNRKGSSFLSEALKGSGMVTWGIRRQVKYLGRHKENDGSDVFNGQNSSSSFVNGVEESQMGLEATCGDEEGDGGEKDEDMENGDGEANPAAAEEEEDEEDEEEEEEDEEEEEEEEDVKIKVKQTNDSLKRKRYSFRNLGARNLKKPKVEIRKQKQTQKKNPIKKYKARKRSKELLIQRDPKDRWSSERYKLAEKNLLEVMKSKGATAEKPILRPQLRAEARKKIGDTGLLDHLLKHMAGKLAPGGQERFRRRHNPDGAMEYWLENAQLVNIRKDAGVTDPYWVPPPGWKPGDSPTQDPICARELKQLKDDVSKIKRNLELMATRRQLEEEVGMLRREIDEISSKRRQQDNQAITVESNHCDISQKLDQLAASFESSKRDFGHVHVSVEKYKEQLMTISEFVKEIEGKFEKLAPNMAETANTGSSLMLAADAHLMREKPAAVERETRKSKEQQQVQDAAALTAAAVEGKALKLEAKAAKIERLKSGFRICKPQGTFLWPNMVKETSKNSNSSSSSIDNSTTFLHVQVEVPTPPSVSSTAVPPQLPYVGGAAAPHYHHYQPPPPPSIVKPLAEKRAVTVKVSTTNTSPLVNLNDVPINLDETTPPVGGNRLGWESGDESWLALCATPKSTSDDSTTHAAS